MSLVGFDQTKKSLPDRFRHHRRLRATALLLENEQRLVELGIAFANLLAKNCDLGMLAAQAQDGCSRDVRMMNIARDEPAEIVGIFSRSTASAFMKQEANAIDVLEELAALGTGGPRGNAE